MSTPSPSWYDVLAVAPDASAAQVRAAWRAAIADLDPTDRRFALLSSAAEVLLDPDRRAAYDAELAAREPEPAPEPVPDAEDRPARAEVAERRTVPGWLLVAVAAAALLVAGAATAVAVGRPSDRSVQDATSAALATAERAVVPVLSYDAAHLEQSRRAAEGYLTGDYRAEYDKLFDGVIAENAPSTGTTVQAEVVRSGVVRASADRVQVFLLVDMTRTNKAEKKPVVYHNWVTVTMDEVDGSWLISRLDT